ncbi:MAG: DNA polymerase III subunit alpha [Caryophanon sp.]|nr:DNA polymerase III subunit alpha [Caryophanon sp.]
MVAYPQLRTSADLLQSTIRLEQCVPFLQQQKAEACAIVNSTLYGLMPFWRSMEQAGIHAVVGLRVDVAVDDTVMPLVLYAKTNDGYQAIVKISSAISTRTDHVLPLKWLQAYQHGTMAMIPYAEGFIEQQTVEAFQQAYTQSVYIGISRPNGVRHITEERTVALAEALNIPVIATQENRYVQREQFFAYTVAQAIQTGIKLVDEEMYEQPEHFMPTAQQWHEAFSDVPHWLEAASAMLLSCRVTMPDKQLMLPQYPLADDVTADAALRELAYDGLAKRLPEATDSYKERLDYELGVIAQMNYSDYFLIVADFMRYAREHNILTGPGRGSSASSLVAYTTFITDVDPLQYGLVFERFLNPERVTMPDIDIDFVDTKRNDVIQYVAQKYGAQHVAQIITFGTLSAKAVARDVARMFNFPPDMLDAISKAIPNKNGVTLDEAYAQSLALQQLVHMSPRHEQWFAVAKELEGLPRNASTHAAGVVLSPKPLVDVIPVEQGHDGVYLTQWPMQEVEAVGLLKMDFLGLRNLTILETIRRSIYYSHGRMLDFEKIPLHNEATFALLQRGDTSGIFQLESAGMKEALRQICPTYFLDVVAVNALYRPGPMDFIPSYARRKHGEEAVVMPHEALRPILQETYGVIIYQEQILKIAAVMAGFTYGEADLLRRAISKKNETVLKEQRGKFVSGAIAKGFDEATARDVYALIERFADYGFPKSHAVAYSYISYYLAYLKANFPANFYAALCTSSIGNQERLHQYIQEAKERGIVVLPPSLHKSQRIFTVENGAIRYGLSAIRGVPQPFLAQLMTVRKQKGTPFTSMYELAIYLSAKHFTQKHIEPLIKAGALDEFGHDRATLLATMSGAMQHASLYRPSDATPMNESVASMRLKYTKAPPLSMKDVLQYEKEALGFYMSAHPVEQLAPEHLHGRTTTLQLMNIEDGAFVKVVGAIEDVRLLRTKKGEQMAFVTVEDEAGTISCTIFPQLFAHVGQMLTSGQLVVAEGQIEVRFGKRQLKTKALHHL